MLERIIDLRSDTVTQPTEEMRRAMAQAELGDDYYREDPTVRALEERASEIMGKEAALFTASGTMSNCIGLMTLGHPGEVVILEAGSHIVRCEGAAISRICGLMPRVIEGRYGQMPIPEIERVISVFSKAVGFPRPTLICLENTHNAAGGTCLTPDYMREVRALAAKHGMRIYVDGARIFNAAIAQKVSPAELAKDVDALGFCLSKGLCCPFGSILVGNRDVIEAARQNRQVLGGGMRQAGIMASAGLVALEKMIERLEEDHMNARLLAERLVEFGFGIDLESVQTNIVFIDKFPRRITRDEVVEWLEKEGIRVGRSGPSRIRMVTHYPITKDDILSVISSMGKLVGTWG